MSELKLNPNSKSPGFSDIGIPAWLCNCDGVRPGICQQSVTVTPGADLLTAVVIDGTSYPIIVTSNDQDELRVAIDAALKDAAYINIKNLSVVNDGGNITITHAGEAKISSVTFGATASATTELCNTEYVCDFQVNYPGGANSLVVVGNTSVTLPATYTYGTDAPSVVQTGLEAALPGVTVVVTDGVGGYIVKITAPSNTDVSIDGRAGTNCGCYNRFVA